MKIIDEIHNENESFVKNPNFRGMKKLIVDNYNDSVHFVYELLQNADDAKATEIEFDLSDNMLEVTHNGIPFNEDDVRSICSISLGTKSDDYTKIGRFGIGFKSVFSYTSKPEIHSGPYDFLIEELILPETVPHIGTRLGTVFRLPLDVSKNTSAIYNEIKDKFIDGDYEMILFLTHLSKIIFKTKEFTKVISKEKIDEHKLLTSNVYQNIRITIEEDYYDYVNKKEYNFLIFRKNNISLTDKDEDGNKLVIKKQSVMIAYLLSDSGDELKCVYRNKFFVFFPTAIRNEYPFLIHAPFITKFSRDTFAENNAANNKLKRSIGILIADSILVLTKGGYLIDDEDDPDIFYQLNIYFFEICGDEIIYNAFITEYKRLLKEKHKLIPTFDNKYVTLDNAVFSDLSESEAKLAKKLFDNEWFIKYFKCGKNFRFCPIEDDDSCYYEFISQFIQNLLTKNFILDKLDSDFLSQKDNDWFKQFCHFLISFDLAVKSMSDDLIAIFYKRNNVENLRDYPLVKLKNGEFINYWELQEKKDIFINNHTIDESLLNDNIVKILYTSIFNLKEYSPGLADARDAIQMIEKYPNISNALYLRYFYKIIEAVNKKLVSPKELKDHKIIKVVNLMTKENKIVKPSEATNIYFNDGDINVYDLYDGLDVDVVIKNAFTNNSANESTYYTLKDLGCISDFREKSVSSYVFLRDNYLRKGVNSYPRFDLYVQTFKDKASYRYFDPFYSMPDVEKSFDCQMTMEKSINLMKVALTKIDQIKDWVQFSSTQNFSAHARYSGDFIGYSPLGIAFTTHKWIYDKQGNLKEPSELTLDELDEKYKGIINKNKKLGKILGMKASQDDVIKKTVAQLKSKGIEVYLISKEDHQILEKYKKAESEHKKKQMSVTEGLQKLNETHISHVIQCQDDSEEYNSIHNKKRREEKIENELEKRKSAPRQKRISVKREVNDEERNFLEMEYHGKCQICGERIISRKGRPVFNATNLIKVSLLNDEGRKAKGLAWNALSLCPNCSTKFRYCNNDFSGLINRIKETNIPESDSDEFLFDIKLDNQDATIEYSPKHLQNFQVAIKYYEKQEKENLEKIMEDDING